MEASEDDDLTGLIDDYVDDVDLPLSAREEEANTDRALGKVLDLIAGVVGDRYQLIKLERLFGEFDEDGSGDINESEFGTALSRLGLDLKQKEVEYVVSSSSLHFSFLLYLRFCHSLSLSLVSPVRCGRQRIVGHARIFRPAQSLSSVES